VFPSRAGKTNCASNGARPSIAVCVSVIGKTPQIYYAPRPEARCAGLGPWLYRATVGIPGAGKRLWTPPQSVPRFSPCTALLQRSGGSSASPCR
jgi:hypothetical protein